jgi:creatinine amidohydrolase
MMNKVICRSLTVLCMGAVLCAFPALASEEAGTPLILQEMTWTDVRDYLERSDMVIIPTGATEQHGPHLPLGTDYYEAMGICRLISARTGVVVAPVLLSGYSLYHSGFPGSLNLKPETMEQVLFETAEMLIQYGFRRFMFFNFHGGNRIVESKVLHRINHTTEAMAVAIGIGSTLQSKVNLSVGFLDSHAGVGESSIMLYLEPDLVKMERAEKPKMNYSSLMGKIYMLARKNPAMYDVLSTIQAVPAETNKKGASHELSDNGIWCSSDPKEATKETGERMVMELVNNAVGFIEDWKKVD